MSDFMSQSYHDVMEAYKRPPSIRFIPRIFGWLTVFILLFGVSKTAYAYETEPVIGFKYHNGQMIGQCVQ